MRDRLRLHHWVDRAQSVVNVVYQRGTVRGLDTPVRALIKDAEHRPAYHSRYGD